MKLTKSQLKELIKQAIVEDIFDKEIKNPKTGNMIKVRTALQLPDEHPANKKAKDMVAKTSIDKGDVGGPSYPNVKKGVKTSKQAKGVFDKEKPKEEPKTPEAMNDYDWDGELQTSELQMLYSDIEDKLSSGTRDNVLDLINKHEELEYEGNYDKAKEIQDLIKKNLDSEFAPKKPKPTPPEGGFERDATAADSRDVRNKVIDKIGKKAFDKLSYGERDKAYDDEFKRQGFVKSGNKYVKKESIKESKKRRFTVKEVRTWMKKLEENRYKKVYNSDARRVAWMVNNEGVSLDEMPISMKKKWTKAQYGRERYLATEFLKSKSEQMNESVWSLPKGATTTSVDELDAELSRAGIKSNPDFTKLLVQVKGNKSKINKIMKTHKAKKIFEGLDLKKLETAIKDFQKKIKKQGRVTNARDEDHLEQLIKVYKQMGGKKIKEQMNESKLRGMIRGIIKEQLNENNISNINKFWSKDVKLTSPEGKSMKKENAKLIKLLNNEMKKLGIKTKFKETLRFTGAYTKVDGKQIFVRFTGPQGSKIQVVGGKEIKLKPNATIKNIAATIAMAATL